MSLKQESNNGEVIDFSENGVKDAINEIKRRNKENGGDYALTDDDAKNIVTSLAKSKQRRYPTTREISLYKTENGLNDVGHIDWEDVTRDTENYGGVTPQFLNTYSNRRAEDQSDFTKILNGAVKGLTTAGTSLIGTLANVPVGTINAIAHGSMDKFWDTPVSNAMHNIDAFMEKAMPNYYTEDELNNEWYENIFTANFIGDKFLKNFGFTFGTMGAVKIAGKLPKFLPKIIKELTTAQRGVNAGIRASRAVNALEGSVLAAAGESSFEAKNNTEELKNKLLREAEDEFNNDKTNLIQQYQQYAKNAPYGINYKELQASFDRDLQTLEDKKNKKIENIATSLSRMGNSDWLANMAILTLTNMGTMKTILEGGFGDARGSLGRYIDADLSRDNLRNAGKMTTRQNTKLTLKGLTRTEQQKINNIYRSNLTKADNILRFTGSSLIEGVEEISQLWASNASEEYARDYYRITNDPRKTTESISYIKSLYNQLGKTIGNVNSWEEFFIGALSGGVSKAIMGETKQLRKERQDVSTMVDKLNNMFNNFSMTSAIKGMNAANSLSEQKVDAAILGDKKEYKDAQFAELAAAVTHLAEVDRLDDLKAIIDYVFDEKLSDEELEVMAKDLSQKSENGQEHNEFAKMTNEEKRKHINKQRDKYNKLIKDYTDARNEISNITGGAFNIEQMSELVYNRLLAKNSVERVNELKKQQESLFDQLKTNPSFNGTTYRDAIDNFSKELDDLSETIAKYEQLRNIALSELKHSYSVQELTSRLMDRAKILDDEKFKSNKRKNAPYRLSLQKLVNQLAEEIWFYKDEVEKDPLLQKVKDLNKLLKEQKEKIKEASEIKGNEEESLRRYESWFNTAKTSLQQIYNDLYDLTEITSKRLTSENFSWFAMGYLTIGAVQNNYLTLLRMFGADETDENFLNFSQKTKDILALLANVKQYNDKLSTFLSNPDKLEEKNRDIRKKMKKEKDKMEAHKLVNRFKEIDNYDDFVKLFENIDEGIQNELRKELKDDEKLSGFIKKYDLIKDRIETYLKPFNVPVRVKTEPSKEEQEKSFFSGTTDTEAEETSKEEGAIVVGEDFVLNNNENKFIKKLKENIEQIVKSSYNEDERIFDIDITEKINNLNPSDYGISEELGKMILSQYREMLGVLMRNEEREKETEEKSEQTSTQQQPETKEKEKEKEKEKLIFKDIEKLSKIKKDFESEEDFLDKMSQRYYDSLKTALEEYGLLEAAREEFDVENDEELDSQDWNIVEKFLKKVYDQLEDISPKSEDSENEEEEEGNPYQTKDEEEEEDGQEYEEYDNQPSAENNVPVENGESSTLGIEAYDEIYGKGNNQNNNQQVNQQQPQQQYQPQQQVVPQNSTFSTIDMEPANKPLSTSNNREKREEKNKYHEAENADGLHVNRKSARYDINALKEGKLKRIEDYKFEGTDLERFDHQRFIDSGDLEKVAKKYSEEHNGEQLPVFFMRTTSRTKDGGFLGYRLMVVVEVADEKIREKYAYTEKGGRVFKGINNKYMPIGTIQADEDSVGKEILSLAPKDREVIQLGGVPIESKLEWIFSGRLVKKIDNKNTQKDERNILEILTKEEKKQLEDTENGKNAPFQIGILKDTGDYYLIGKADDAVVVNPNEYKTSAKNTIENEGARKGTYWIVSQEADGRKYFKATRVNVFSEEWYNKNKDTHYGKEIDAAIKELVNAKTEAERKAALLHLKRFIYTGSHKIFKDPKTGNIKIGYKVGKNYEIETIPADSETIEDDIRNLLFKQYNRFNIFVDTKYKTLTPSVKEIVESNILRTDLGRIRNANASVLISDIEIDKEKDTVTLKPSVTGRLLRNTEIIHTGNVSYDSTKERFEVYNIEGKRVATIGFDNNGNLVFKDNQSKEITDEREKIKILLQFLNNNHLLGFNWDYTHPLVRMLNENYNFVLRQRTLHSPDTKIKFGNIVMKAESIPVRITCIIKKDKRNNQYSLYYVDKNGNVQVLKQKQSESLLKFMHSKKQTIPKELYKSLEDKNGNIIDQIVSNIDVPKQYLNKINGSYYQNLGGYGIGKYGFPFKMNLLAYRDTKQDGKDLEELIPKVKELTEKYNQTKDDSIKEERDEISKKITKIVQKYGVKRENIAIGTDNNGKHGVFLVEPTESNTIDTEQFYKILKDNLTKQIDELLKNKNELDNEVVAALIGLRNSAQNAPGLKELNRVKDNFLQIQHNMYIGGNKTKQSSQNKQKTNKQNSESKANEESKVNEEQGPKEKQEVITKNKKGGNILNSRQKENPMPQNVINFINERGEGVGKNLINKIQIFVQKRFKDNPKQAIELINNRKFWDKILPLFNNLNEDAALKEAERLINSDEIQCL